VFLALDVVVEAGFGQPTGVGDVLDGGGLVPSRADEPGRGLEDFAVALLGVVGSPRRHLGVQAVGFHGAAATHA
jgi:hypothetical protein